MLRKYTLLFLLLCLSCSTQAIEQYDYRVIDRKPQARDLWVQGLEIRDGMLYLSAGRHGESRLMRYHFDSGDLETGRRLNDRLFAEGLTVLEEHIYQLTWHARMVLVFSKDEMKFLEWFPISGEGWGLTNNGQDLIYSDGSDQLHYLSPHDRRLTRSVKVTENGRPVRKLNELEWIDGKIWANIWRTNRIVIIDPDSGVVTASVDLTDLLPTSARRADTGVLNGIARNPADGAIWVTGKRWPWLYRIELQPVNQPQSTTDSR